ncbi:MAG: transcription termination/antitermination protein NusA [Clostridia bacterium]|nr:transcription termination/antitermination protein NusA [Clostridia bacterium]
MIDKNENREMIEAVAMLAKEKSISKEVLFSAIEEALRSAYKNNFNKQYGVPPSNANVRVELDRVTGAVRLYARKTVEKWPTDEASEISIEEARAIQPSYDQGDIVEVEVTPNNFRRVAAQTAKQVIVQKIREAERGKIYDDFIEKENEILTAIVHSVDPENKTVYVELGKTEGALEVAQQMAADVYVPGERFKVYLLEVVADRRLARPGAKYGPQVSVSRIHPGLVKRLFEMEVPEIQSGIVQIKSIAREAGSRTKIAVCSSDPMIDPVGSCVGPRGQRVDRVVTELRGEKIDIIKWSADPAEFVANALNPAHVVSVFVNEKEKACRVVVPDNQLSLAIGKEGQNARLAARLTGWKIDIKSQSQIDEQMLASEQEAAGEEA